MPRLFLGNFEFEHHLADRGYQPSATVARRNAELATSWLAVAEDGDYVWFSVPAHIVSSFLARLADQHGLPRIVPVLDLSRVPAGLDFVPWGWTDPVIQMARLRRWSFAAPHPRIVRECNSRQYSFDLESEWEVGLPGASAVSDLSQWDAALRRAMEISHRTVIKASWGMSGRERILLDGELPESARSWVQKRIAQQGVVFVEPWVRNLEEIGIQIQIPQLGTPQLIGVTSLVNDELGQYRGSWFTIPPNAGADFQSRWQPAVNIALKAADRLQDHGYFGPLGIDAMRYQLPDGSIHVRPLQDINARWTMGRLSIGWRRFLRNEERGFWWQGPDAELGGTQDPHRKFEISLPKTDARNSPWISRVIFLPPDRIN